MTEMSGTPTTHFEDFTSTPDKDGDHVAVTRNVDHYRVKATDADGDFQMVYVSLKDMVDLAYAVIEADGDQ